MTEDDSKQLAVLVEVVTRREHRLFGNGKEGVIDEHAGRISKLENWRFWVVGIAVGAGMVLGFGSHIVWGALTK